MLNFLNYLLLIVNFFIFKSFLLVQDLINDKIFAFLEKS